MRKLFPASLAGRLTATSIALVAVTCLLIAVAATLIMRTYLIDRLDRDVERSLDRAETSVQGPGGPDGGNNGGADGEGDGPPVPPRGNREGSLTAVVDTSGSRGAMLTASGEARALSDDQLESLNDVVADEDPITVDVPDLGSFRVAATDGPYGQALVVQGIPTDDVDDTISTLLWWELGLGATGVAAAALAGRTLVRRQLRPLREVAQTAERVTHLDLASGEVGRTERVPAEFTDPATEVGQVGGALNQLLGHVETALDARHESEQQARQFLADASHELRTPLSTIKGYAELSRRMSDPDDLSQVLSKVDSESLRMTRLVEDMLLLARLDAGRNIEPRPVDLTRVVADAVHDAAVVDPDRTWNVSLPPDPITIDGDEQRLHQLVTNLLRNASRHTGEGTRVVTSLEVDGANVRLMVADNGPGIDPELLPTIFDRFTRGDSSRTRASGGAGLGTSLVQAIAHAHGGRVSVTSAPGQTEFIVLLPRDQAAADS